MFAEIDKSSFTGLIEKCVKMEERTRMINIEEARRIAQKLVSNSGLNVEIANITEVENEKEEDSLFVFCVEDLDNKACYYPGELFPAIRKGDGELVDFKLIPPGF